nr:PREDICTED: Down syndrome cell adhesion molecule-like protein Dscam2 isoform X3 [Bemisia tabaci]
MLTLRAVINSLVIYELAWAFDSVLQGPSLLMEPPSKLEFSNSSGAWLDCSATGNPTPMVEWTTVDGAPVTDVPGVRRLLHNGTLHLLPFSAAAFRSDIHSTVYRCAAANTVGRIISRDVQVRAVVAQAYKISVDVLVASRGCTAILQCSIPGFVKEYVRVVSWVQEPNLNIYASHDGDGKFHVLPTGELLVHNIEYRDQFTAYRCRTTHRLTGQIVVSTAVNIRMSDVRGVVAPAIVQHTASVQVSQDEGAVLLCVAQACPQPEYRWFQMGPGGEPLMLEQRVRVRVAGPVLAIKAVTSEDAGLYKCSASNPAGEAQAELRLNVLAPLHVQVVPAVLSVHIGGIAEFKCVVSGSGYSGHLIGWYKDGRPILSGSSGRVTGDSLVVSSVGREDRGMYQCLVRRAEGETAQASAELQLGDAAPILTYNFIEQTLQPGPAVSLKCSATGNPTPHITWHLDGFPLPQSNRFVIGQYVTIHGDVISHVNISQVAVDDGGEYSCTAENRAGKAQHAARLNIYGPPFVRSIPKVTAVAGETLKLKCPVAGYPIDEIHWEKSGRELPEDLRQKILPGGVLIVSNVQKNVDAGVYTCRARNKQGQMGQRSGEVVIIVPPLIEPFSIPSDGLAEGMRTRIVCGVSHGDPPITISWLKDGLPLPAQLGVNVSTLDSFSSLLSIPHLSSAHSGDYTCVASNPASQVRYSANLQVKVPPKWSVEPMDVSVLRNQPALLNCQAQGVPQPSTVWKKATGSKSGEYEIIKERMFVKLLSNGSLLLQNVKEDQEGYYLCQATNGIGSPLGKVVHLKVNSPPYFTESSQHKTVKKTDNALLECKVKGDKPINVVWQRSGEQTKMNSLSDYRVVVRQEVTEDGVLASLHIKNADASDTGHYYCQASNLYGKDQQLVQLLVQEPPKSPSNVKAVMVTSQAVNLQWEHLSEDVGEVTAFIVQYKRSGESGWKKLEVNSQQRGALIDDLKPATNYLLRVISEGSAGQSSPSNEILITTESQRPAGPPLEVSVRALSSTELLVTWSPPHPDYRHGEIIGYNVGFKESNSGSSSYNMTEVLGDGDKGTGEHVFTDLSKYTRYLVVVQAYNSIGQGPLSEPVNALTLEDAPSAPPEDVRCAALSSQSLQVSWQPPPLSLSNGLIQGYKILYDSQDPGADQLETRKTTALTIVVSGLRKFTNYTIQVLAFTKMGSGPYSYPLPCTTDEDVPGAPEDIKVVLSSAHSLLVSWLPPKEPNGVITKYNFYTRVVNGNKEELNHAKRNLPSQQTHFEAKGLQQHIEYQFWVTASTKIGEGQSSRVVSQMPTARVPARIFSFGRVVFRAWRTSVTLACQMVGVPQPHRTWLVGDRPLHSNGHNIQILDSGELFLTNLQRNNSDNYTCQVENVSGSDKITHTLVIQVLPAAPVLYVTSATSSSILLHWKVPDRGGAPLTGFTLTYRMATGEPQDMPLSRKTTSYELKNLLCGNAYQLTLVAHNKLGSSTSSAVIYVRTQGQHPGIPEYSEFIFPNSTAVTLKLPAWPDNGCQIQRFTIRYRSVNDIEWAREFPNVRMKMKFVISGLVPSSEYVLQVYAVNLAGSSVGDFTFFTLNKDGEPLPQAILKHGHLSGSFYADFRILISLLASVLVFLAILSVSVFFWRNKKGQPMKESLDNQQNSQMQRERYYATIHKVAMQEKVPETSDDISPYATFQLTTEPNNTLLHSFMYHERGMTEGCASPPPHAIAKSRRMRRVSCRKNDAESDDSDSDGDPLTSSRTESSNQLETAKVKHTSNFIYHGAQSSTSSDLSPMSEQKSLPRQGRSRWLVPNKGLRTSLSIVETSFRGGIERPELSEAECDIDTLKKLKLGIRSSLWSRPSNNQQHSDYSIAV